MNYEKSWEELKKYLQEGFSAMSLVLGSSAASHVNTERLEGQLLGTKNALDLLLTLESENKRQYSTDKNPYSKENAPKATDTDRESTSKSNT